MHFQLLWNNSSWVTKKWICKQTVDRYIWYLTKLPNHVTPLLDSPPGSILSRNCARNHSETAAKEGHTHATYCSHQFHCRSLVLSQRWGEILRKIYTELLDICFKLELLNRKLLIFASFPLRGSWKFSQSLKKLIYLEDSELTPRGKQHRKRRSALLSCLDPFGVHAWNCWVARYIYIWYYMVNKKQDDE